MSISIEHVTKRFGDEVAVNDVSLEIPQGSLTAILGPSGSGKSTLLRIIAGLEALDSGTVAIEGDDVTNQPARLRRIGFCFQHYAPFSHMTVEKNVAFGLKVQKKSKSEIRDRVGELLETVQLSEYAKRYPSQLSGGQRQRMALARALAPSPRVLLLDEPFSALDAQIRGELRVWLRELHEKIPVTTVFVTHDQLEAMEIADRLVVMNKGAVEQLGRPTELYEAPSSGFVESFLGPVTTYRGATVRPHDLVITSAIASGQDRAVIDKITDFGSLARLDLTVDGGEAIWAQLSHRELAALGCQEGATVGVTLVKVS